MYPPVGPYLVPELVCSNPKCHEKLITVINAHSQGGVGSLTAYCPNCKYGYRMNPTSVVGEFVKHPDFVAPGKPKTRPGLAEPETPAPAPAA